MRDCSHLRIVNGSEYSTDTCYDCGVEIFPGRRSDLAGLAAREDFASRIEPAPRTNAQPACWDLVISDVLYLFAASDPIRDLIIADMQKRDRFGAEKYKTRLQPFNGRKPIVDAYQEALDLCVYLRQALFEKDTPERNRAYRYALDVASILRREMSE